MQNAVFMFRNRVPSATLTAGSEQAGLTVGNLASPHGNAADAWQTAAGVKTSYFVVDAGSNVTWRGFLLARTNLTAAATVRWRVWTAANYPSGATAYDSTALAGTIDAEVGQSVIVAATTSTGRYARCDIADGSNPDNFLNVALAYAGPVWQPNVNIGRGARYVPERTESGATARGGSEYARFHFLRRAWEIPLPWVSEAEVAAEMWELERAMTRGDNVGFIRDPDSAIAASEAVFGRGYALEGQGFPAEVAGYRSWRIRVAERL